MIRSAEHINGSDGGWDENSFGFFFFFSFSSAVSREIQIQHTHAQHTYALLSSLFSILRPNSKQCVSMESGLRSKLFISFILCFFSFYLCSGHCHRPTINCVIMSPRESERKVGEGDGAGKQNVLRSEGQFHANEFFPLGNCVRNPSARIRWTQLYSVWQIISIKMRSLSTNNICFRLLYLHKYIYGIRAARLVISRCSLPWCLTYTFSSWKNRSFSKFGIRFVIIGRCTHDWIFSTDFPIHSHFVPLRLDMVFPFTQLHDLLTHTESI